MKNDHMAFEVSNMDASIQFYTQTLGLRLLFRNVNAEEQEDYAFLELAGGNLELIQRLDGEPFVKPAIKPPYCPHLALTSEDMAQTLQMIEEHRIPVVKGPLEIAGAEKWIYISDPDNNILEYIQWLKR
jgi:catechol 2,3-dioxygenase-like lactoylglutathione lyase family enzyme